MRRAKRKGNRKSRRKENDRETRPVMDLSSFFSLLQFVFHTSSISNIISIAMLAVGARRRGRRQSQGHQINFWDIQFTKINREDRGERLQP